MNLIDKQVTHKVFGEGKVVNCDDSYIKVDFLSGKKKFVFPDAFESYLTLNDQRAAGLVQEVLEERMRKRAEQEQKLKELLIERNKKRQKLAVGRSGRIHPSSQSVFWCDKDEEDSIFADWQVFTGTIKSGQNKGRPRNLARISRNSGCLITMRNQDEPEKDRRIVGVYMVAENFNSRDNEDGYIPAHPEYRIRLTDEEAKKMLFWNYYINKNHPERMTWKTGRHRYFDNIWMAQILADIIELRQDQTEEDETLKDFLAYFCRLNRINQDELTKPEGALKKEDQ